MTTITSELAARVVADVRRHSHQPYSETELRQCVIEVLDELSGSIALEALPEMAMRLALLRMQRH